MLHARSARVYDLLFAAMGHDCASQAAEVACVSSAATRSAGRRLLDVGCGTGAHLAHLRTTHEVVGLDLSSAMLAVARERLPEVPLHEGDAVTFQLADRFDCVVFLHGGIGYVRTLDRLVACVRNLAQHTTPGGAVLVDAWFTPEDWAAGRMSMVSVDDPDAKVCRITRTGQQGRISLLEMHYLVATEDGVEQFVEHHELGLFTAEEYRSAFAEAGLIMCAERPLRGRVRYVASKPDLDTRPRTVQL